jgi:hypothetical protein
MPRPIQTLSLLSLLTDYLETGLGIFLKGAGWTCSGLRRWPWEGSVPASSRWGSGGSAARWGEPLARGVRRLVAAAVTVNPRPRELTREDEMMPHVGSPAIEFALEDIAGAVHRLEHYRGQWLLMVFHRHLG